MAKNLSPFCLENSYMIKSSNRESKLLINPSNKIQMEAVLSRHVVSALRKSLKLKAGKEELFRGFIFMLPKPCLLSCDYN